MRDNPYEFYATPEAFTRYLFRYMAHRGTPIVGRILEPCVGDGAIIRAAALRPMEFGVANTWVTNDIDTRWNHADRALDATKPEVWDWAQPDFVIGNPPFTPALEIITHALRVASVGVAMHLRASIHEVLKTGVRRTWMAEHKPTGILWLPRFAYQRSKTTGLWTTDSVCACWVIWLKRQSGQDAPAQFIDYAPESVIDELTAETPAHRKRMDDLVGVEVL